MTDTEIELIKYGIDATFWVACFWILCRSLAIGLSSLATFLITLRTMD